jgi:replicative DNA helicase
MLQNVEAEAALLGSILATYGTLEDALPLAAEEFSHPPYAATFRAMLHLHRHGQPVDEVSVMDRLKAAGELVSVGGPPAIHKLSEEVPPLSRPGPHAARIREAAHRRHIREAAIRAAEAASDPTVPPEKAALDASATLAQLGSAGVQKIRTFRDSMQTLLERLDAIRQGTYEHYIPTGIEIWDELLGGLARGIVTLLPAYPGVGKGAVAGRILLNLAQSQRKCGIFSLEDPEYWVAKRYLADASGIPVRALMEGKRTSDIRDNYVQDAAMQSLDWGDNMLIDERTGLSADQIAATARQMVVQRGAEVIVIDNASEVDVSGDERHDVRTAHMVRVLRDVAKGLNVSVLLLMHLKKNGNTSKEGAFLRPTTELLKNTTGFAEVARAIVALWRAEDSKDEIIATILKQTEGERDLDFTMSFNASAGLVHSLGGRKRDGDKGYTESTKGAA